MRRAGDHARPRSAPRADLAEPGDVVLLSPACASFDWYDGYAERGDDFQREVALVVAESDEIGPTRMSVAIPGAVGRPPRSGACLVDAEPERSDAELGAARARGRGAEHRRSGDGAVGIVGAVDRRQGSPWWFFDRQVVGIAIGAVGFVLASRFDYRSWRRHIPVLLGVTGNCCSIVLIPGIGIKVDGARRWLGFGAVPRAAVGDREVRPVDLHRRRAGTASAPSSATGSERCARSCVVLAAHRGADDGSSPTSRR